MEQKATIRAELDVFYASKYGLNRTELLYVLDPKEVYGTGYPSETFRVLRDREIKHFRRYKTLEHTLECWDSSRMNTLV